MNCSAKTRGGAICFWGGGSVSGCSFVNCSVISDGDSWGGAIYFWGGGSVSGCSFVNCSAISDGDSWGGAIYSEFN